MPDYRDITNYLGNKQTQPVGLFKKNNPQQVYWFSSEPTVMVTMEKVIVRKNVLKKGLVDGTAKELFSTGDYTITIEGVLQAMDDKGFRVYPSTDVAELSELMEEEDALGIICDLTNTFNIGLIAIQRFAPQREANTLRYSIMGYSDKDIIIA
jgi:Domain of unknown function (DUF6046)